MYDSSYPYGPFSTCGIFHSFTKSPNATSTPSQLPFNCSTHTSRLSSIFIFVLARGDQSATSKFQSWNYFNPSHRASSGRGAFLSGQQMSPNTCMLSTSKNPAKTPMVAITPLRSATTLTVRRSAGILTLQPDFKRLRSLPTHTWLMILIGYLMHRQAMTKTGSRSFLMSLRRSVHLGQPPICLQPLTIANHNQIPHASLERLPPLRPPSI